MSENKPIAEPESKPKVECHLRKQSLEDLEDESTLHALTPQFISRQATINIGTIGHVAHGKTTVVKAISGVKTIRFKAEMVRNITIKLGFANCKVYKCDNPECKPPNCYSGKGSAYRDFFPCTQEGCDGTMKLVRHVSFVDCPGHEILTATMLSGAAVMDGALLLIAGNETFPQPQTCEHLAAVMIMKLRHIVVLQNKLDLVTIEDCLNQYKEIKRFVKGTIVEKSPILPISAQLKYNIDAVWQHLVTSVPIPARKFSGSPRFIVIRSFDVNKPGEEIENLKGGVVGGSILYGIFKIGQEIEFRPGRVLIKGDKVVCQAIRSKVVSLQAEQNELMYAVPGGLIGVGSNIDPTLTRGDRLVGQVLGEVGTLPSVFCELEVSYYLLSKLLGVKNKKQEKITALELNEFLMFNIGSTSSGAQVVGLKADLAKVLLTTPVCTSVGEKVAISRRVDKHWRLIGWGTIMFGREVQVVTNTDVEG